MPEWNLYQDINKSFIYVNMNIRNLTCFFVSNFDQLYMCILNLYHIKPEVSMVWQMYIFCHHNTCSFHFCGTKLMYVYCIKRVPRLHQRAPNGTQIFKISRGRPPGPPQREGATPSHTLPRCRLRRHRRRKRLLVSAGSMDISTG